MRPEDFEMKVEEVEVDDNTLVQLYKETYKTKKEKKKYFEKQLSEYNDNNYLSYVVARLAYYFAREECNTLYSEANRRGLLLNQKQCGC